MKRFLTVTLLLTICIFALLSCGLSATQIKENLTDNGYTTRNWTTEEAREHFGAIYDKDEYEITAVLEGTKDSCTIIAVQLATSAQAKALKDELVVDEPLQIVVEGRLLLIGEKADVNAALGKAASTDSSSDSSK